MTFPPEAADKLLAAADQAGVARETLFAAAGIAPEAALDYAALCALYEAGARLTRDGNFGLRVGTHTRPDMYGLLGYAAAHSASLGEALERLVALQGVWTDAVALELKAGGGVARLRYRSRVPVPPRQRRQECEQMIAAIASFATAATGGAARPIEVRFEHQAPPDVAEHKRVFGCPILFRARSTGLSWPMAALGLALAGTDPKLGALIRVQAEGELAGRRRRAPLVETVRAAVRDGLERGAAPGLAEAAAAAGLGPRTLQRRLRDLGMRWTMLVDGVRIELARELLADPRLGISQIAFEAGFSQASAFHRAFRRIAGTTPRRYRLELAATEERR
ncbi:MAG TPA: AraC family transcriptional regulator ligand-binding domain-containing protein [Allosphingosinicella sp.]|nr:AraC family transcriptional regulator ligand-binding domain-containing protein [Allosphingosinicella sp.]